MGGTPASIVVPSFQTTIEVLAAVQQGLSSDWANNQNVIPDHVLCRETDTGRYKVGDGNHTYAQLPYSYINVEYPVACVLEYAGTSLPLGWLWCDGAAYDRTTYSALFSEIGTTFGAGDGSTTFNVPNRNGRIVVPVADNAGASLPTMKYIIRCG